MKREFVINRHGKDYVLYAGLLDEAHQQGLCAIKTQLLQAPSTQNGQMAICLAEVTTEKGTFTGIGDAEPGNVNRAMANALIRMAETRAKARALRDAVNVSMLSIEELAESAPESIELDNHAATTSNAAVMVAGAPAGSSPNASSPPSLPPGVVPLVPRQQPSASEPAAQMPRRQAPAETNAPVPAPEAELPVSIEASRARRLREAAQKTNGAVSAAASKPGGEDRPAPATQTQIETIAKLARSIGRAVPTGDLTRAEASELISRLSEERYGARRGSTQPK